MAGIGYDPPAGSSVSLPIAESDVTGLVTDLAAKTTPAAALAAAKAVSLDQFAVPAADLSANSHKITNLTNGSGAQDAAAFGQIPVAGGVGGFAKIVRRTSNAGGMNSATPAADDTLLWAVVANEVDFFEAFLLFNCADATHDIKLAWAVPASCTMLWGAGIPANTLAGYGAAASANSPIPMLTESATPGYGSAAGTIGLYVAGIVTNSSTAGNVNLKWGCATGGGGSINAMTNSLIRIARMA